MHQQVAALPVRVGRTGAIEVLLVTSRETRRWVIPKGWPQPERSDPFAAAREALEEAGVEGTIEETSLGHYHYVKRRTRRSVGVEVAVYILHVTRELATWPEARQRERVWLTPTDAAERVDEPELRQLILGLTTWPLPRCEGCCPPGSRAAFEPSTSTFHGQHVARQLVE